MEYNINLEKEYLKKIKEAQQEEDDDQEVRHIREDELLCELLIELGFNKFVKQYHSTNKWYA